MKPRPPLDYTNPDLAVNFRDAGEFINLIAGHVVLPEGRIFRGGTLRAITNPSVIGNPKTIFCLQKGSDYPIPGVTIFHFPISKAYGTVLPEKRAWLRDIVSTIEQGIEFPLYIHCLSGRDRTGVVTALLLKICGADEDHIAEEYELSDGANVPARIRTALSGFRDLDEYFAGIDLVKVKAALLG